MLKFMAKRLLEGLITLIALSMIVFASAHMTGDPARLLIPESAFVSEDTYERLREELGLNDPLVVQYYRFAKGLVTRLDFGDSLFMNGPARDILFDRFPNTVQLGAVAILLTIVLGVPLGVLSAVKRDSIFDKTAKGFAIFGMAAPQFWVAIMMILLFSVRLGWLPTHGKGGLDHFILPAFALAFSVIAVMMRLTRSSMLEVLDSEYVKFARVKGLKERIIIWKHAIRNGLIPVLTFSGIMIAIFLNGSIIVEVVFGWPGIGTLMLAAITNQDFALLQATVLTAGFFYVVTSFLIDILYGYADPRIRVS